MLVLAICISISQGWYDVDYCKWTLRTKQKVTVAGNEGHANSHPLEGLLMQTAMVLVELRQLQL